MKKIALALAAASALLLTTGVQAQANNSSPLYGEVGYTSLKYSGSGLSAKPGALRGIIGYGFHPNFAVEGMLAFGVKDDNTTFSGVPITVKLDNAAGIFLKPRVNATPELELYARLGYVDFKSKASAAGVSASGSDSDTAYGVGLSYKVSRSISVGVDYMSYVNKDGGKIDGFTLGLGMSF